MKHKNFKRAITKGIGGGGSVFLRVAHKRKEDPDISAPPKVLM